MRLFKCTMKCGVKTFLGKSYNLLCGPWCSNYEPELSSGDGKNNRVSPARGATVHLYSGVIWILSNH